MSHWFMFMRFIKISGCATVVGCGLWHFDISRDFFLSSYILRLGRYAVLFHGRDISKSDIRVLNYSVDGAF